MGFLNRHTGGGNGYGVDSTFGSGRVKGKARKWLIIGVAVLLILAIGASAGLNIAILFNDEEDEDESDGMSTVTYLYVQLMQGSKDKPGKGIAGANVVLKQQIKKDPAEYTLGPTDKDGIASMVLPTGGAAKFTYPCPPEFKPDSKGRPTVAFKIYHKGNTFYSQGTNHGYGSGFGFSQISAKQDHLTSQEGKPAASDTWHILAKQGSGSHSNGMCYDEVCYVAQKDGYDYGTGIIEDWGSGLTGNGADIDCYAPYSKYYSNGQDNYSGLMKWFKAMGVPTNTSFAHGDGTVYVMGKDEADSKAYGKKIREQITANGGQPWPGTTPADPRTGGGSSSGSKGEDTSAYTVSYKKGGTSSGSSKVSWGSITSGTQDNPYIVSASGYFYKFWTVTVTNGTGITGQDIPGLNSEEELKAHPEANENHGVGRQLYKGINYYNHDTREVYTGCALPDCTSWVDLRVYETQGRHVSHPIYKESARLTAVSQLKVGDYIEYIGSRKHVAYIEAVNGDTVTISESGQSYYGQNLKAGLPHPWYQVGTYQGIAGLQGHHPGTMYVNHPSQF